MTRVVLLLTILGAASAAAQTSTVVVPDVTAPIAATATSSENYRAKLAQSVDRFVRERWLTESDARKIKAEAATVAVVSSN